MKTLIKATIVILVGCYISSSPDIFSKEKDKFSMKIYGVDPFTGKKDFVEGSYIDNIYEISQSCLYDCKIELIGSAKNVTISIECKDNGKRIYYRKGQTIKGVYKIPFNEIGIDECNIDDESIVSEETEYDRKYLRLQIIKDDSLDERAIVFDCLINTNCSANSGD
jgi:hypothetical protein